MGSIIWSIIIGAIAGSLAKLIMPGKDGGGIIMTIILGIAGSLLFTFLGRLVGWYGTYQGNCVCPLENLKLNN